MKRSFRFNPEFCLIDKDFGNPKSICVFDTWSLHHFFWQGAIYIILHELFKIKNIEQSIFLFLILTILHIFEEYIGNISRISIEGIIIDNLGPIINPRVNPKKRKIDNDYLDNSLGDILSGIISNLIIILFWYKYKSVPYWYLLFFFPIFYNLLNHAPQLY